MEQKKIRTAFVSVFHKEKLENLLGVLANNKVQIISTGGTYDYITALGLVAVKAEEITGLSEMLGGRVKTLHPVIFGGILARRDNEMDQQDLRNHGIAEIDMVVVDLYPFVETDKTGVAQEAVIEKIDIGGISLIRAAAKNFRDVLIVPSSDYYNEAAEILRAKNGCTEETDRRRFSARAFDISSTYDAEIYRYISGDSAQVFKHNAVGANHLRYGENPHQKGVFYGNMDEVFTKIQGKEISYNNLLDIDAGISLIKEFDEPTVAILKHNNACGVASRPTVSEAWDAALAGDPVSAFGGVIIFNQEVGIEVAEKMNALFFEVLIAPSYTQDALGVLASRKNRILLQQNNFSASAFQFRALLNGVLVQDRDFCTEGIAEMKLVTEKQPTEEEYADLIFANKIVKHSRSNAIVLAKDRQLTGSGIGQTSRVDALKQAIIKAQEFGFDLQGAVLASDAFFPFSDCVEIGGEAGVTAIVQPGGSVRDSDSIEVCNKNGIAMVFSGRRHFRH